MQCFKCDIGFFLLFFVVDVKVDAWNYHHDYENIVDDGYCFLYNANLTYAEFVVKQVSHFSAKKLYEFVHE